MNCHVMEGCHIRAAGVISGFIDKDIEGSSFSDYCLPIRYLYKWHLPFKLRVYELFF